MNDDSAVSILRGRCLCGAVTLNVRHDKPSMSVCHCGICRRWSGGPFMTLECHQPPDIEGIEHVRTYASSEWAERGFCAHCGTHLFYRLAQDELYAVPVGMFEEGGQWPFELQIFIDRKPENYRYANSTREMTEEEVIKAWSR